MIKFNTPPLTVSEESSHITNWLHSVAKGHGYRIKNLVYNFVTNADILRINKEHLDHDYYTDIISFDYSEGNRVSGEIFISTEQVSQQAKELGEPEGRELLRVMVHGLLHMIGFDDHTEEEKAEMRKEEEKSLILHAQKIDS